MREKRVRVTPPVDRKPASVRPGAVMAGLCLLALGAMSAGCSDKDGSFLLSDEARIQIDPTSISFGDVPRGQTALQTVTIRHTGTGGVIVLDPIALDSSSPDLSIGVVEKTTLQPGEEGRIQIVYESADDAPDFGELVIGHNLALSRETRIPITTPGQRAILVANPSTVDFGIVQAGAPKVVNLRLSNIGSAAATVVGYEVVDDPDGDFTAQVPADLTIEPNSTGQIQLSYAPSGRDSDRATVVIRTEREDVTVTVPVEGEEKTPLLIADPNTIQFGWAEPGRGKQVTVQLRNEGNEPLEILAVSPNDLHPFVSVLLDPLVWDFPVVLDPGEDVNFAAFFEPTEQLPMRAGNIGEVIVRSTDAANDPKLIPVFGAAGDPSLIVVPDDVVDFGFVAEGFTGVRTVTLLNVGQAAVSVLSADLIERTTDEFRVNNPEAIPATLNPGESVVLELAFENREGAKGTEFARLLLTSNDPIVPEYVLDVIGRRAERPTCEPAFAPELLSMGAVRMGSEAEDTLRIVNFGAGNCEYREYELDGCLPIQMGARRRYDCQIRGLQTPFSVVSAPPYGKILGPGGSLEFKVHFDAPDVSDNVVGRESYFAKITSIMHDPNTNGFKFVAPAGGWMRGVNLRAESAIPIVRIQPDAHEFGRVRTDCQSSAGLVSIRAIGPMEAQILSVEPIDCGPGFIINSPPTPGAVPGFSTSYIETFFAPSTAGEQSCTLRITTDAIVVNAPDKGAVFDVTLHGDGIDVTHQVDTFDQVPPSKVDVLFVVDDSGSMADEQARLKRELPNLVAIAADWAQDYQMAVTSTDTVLDRGRFEGSPRIATPADDPADFADNLLVGVNGYWEEMGLEAAWMALSGLHTESTDLACVNAPGQCPEYLPGVYYWCIEGYCRGNNYGFLRDDAELVIIIVSDEEDSSPESPSWYVSRLMGLKPLDSGVGVKINAIVTTDDECFQGFGTIGTRYIQAVNITGGVYATICADDFSDEFEKIGENTFGLNDRFYPTLPPDPPTLEVRVDGEPCTTGWHWNPEIRAVVFDRGGACFPEYGQRVELEYDVICQSPPEP